jgi:carbamoyltransferase
MGRWKSSPQPGTRPRHGKCPDLRGYRSMWWAFRYDYCCLMRLEHHAENVMNVLGLNPGVDGFNSHDPAACISEAGSLVAMVEEERLIRIRSAPGLFPRKAIDACLRFSGLDFADLDCIAVGYSHEEWQKRLPLESAVALRRAESAFASIGDRESGGIVHAHRWRDAFVEGAREINDLAERSAIFADARSCKERLVTHLPEAADVPFRFYRHHLCHAASAFHTSGFSASTVVVLDGVGEIDCATVWHGNGDDIQLVEVQQLPNSIGYFYASFTHYLGFKGFYGEGKLMALAPYGGCNQALKEKLENRFVVNERGYNVSQIMEPLIGRELQLDLNLATRELARLCGAPPRQPHDPLTQFHRDVAWFAQDFLERGVIAFVRNAIRQTENRNVCFAGGVALNCKLNMRLRELRDITRLFVQPLAADMGVALGAAILADGDLRRTCSGQFSTLALGTSELPASIEIARELRARHLAFDEFPLLEPFATAVAEQLARRRIVMWFSGRSEVGPRALGQRSILGDPRDPAVRDRINSVVKSRELWRPLGPSILETEAPDVLENFEPGSRAPYMIEAFRMNSQWRQRVPAVVHSADGTTRPHTVNAALQPDYAAVIHAFARLTGVPMVINTSFNRNDEPLVETFHQAIEDFLATGADVLVIGRIMVVK